MATLADFLDDANMEDTVDGDLLEDVEALNYDDLLVMTVVDLKGLFPSAFIMVVSVTASTISESRMGYIAPNLSAIVGSVVAAKLMGTAGGDTATPPSLRMCACGFLAAKSTLGMLTKLLDCRGIGTNNFSGTVPSKLGKLSKLEHGNKQFLWSSVIRAC
ncbi:hypothetical protein Pint_06964 [Pistacia integerrima]|uniref:Uncharacterized protein n=1 Tax=Pistacia integerrima TaxID=434235 RepID=A0ACC0XYH1_9ROSI|nr:hypothetical protein Pint_06964 [Pistacia integerrima]